jgi:hypothetical protein
MAVNFTDYVLDFQEELQEKLSEQDYNEVMLEKADSEN